MIPFDPLIILYKNKHPDIDKLLYPGVFYKEKLQKNEIKYIKKLYKPCYTLYVTLNSVGEKDVISNRKSQ